ncbi:hypothetical protein GGTG_02882 [Gaeumannomyces tritici R3-111a-1]|uniref:Uncharacterized protein n=1 Tax=Gaeumannomyces tritici (strain R3-111a-1) TaxID=644352 RepID=J3NNM5_GAET3|nr:hypothetical protein GGTG_02882 [Gaeumannomyces tritici R3-111a-1]EJT77777.1 hypothetical protein GGTG_02882 [Gaeumannomyces tritici R3-111a-1]
MVAAAPCKARSCSAIDLKAKTNSSVLWSIGKSLTRNVSLFGFAAVVVAAWSTPRDVDHSASGAPVGCLECRPTRIAVTRRVMAVRKTAMNSSAGHTRLRLGDQSALWDFLAKEFCSNDLGKIAGRLWWMSKQDSGNISLLHRQLMKYESDLRIAQDLSLQPFPPGITWEQFCNFTPGLANIPDRDVSPRYAYGEICLTRLNFYAPFLGKLHFQRVKYQYGTYFARFHGPILFVLAVVRVGGSERTTDHRRGRRRCQGPGADGRGALDKCRDHRSFLRPSLF